MVQDHVLTMLSNVPLGSLGKWNLSEIQCFMPLPKDPHVFACVCLLHSIDGFLLECLIRLWKYSCSFFGCVPLFTTIDWQSSWSAKIMMDPRVKFAKYVFLCIFSFWHVRSCEECRTSIFLLPFSFRGKPIEHYWIVTIVLNVIGIWLNSWWFLGTSAEVLGTLDVKEPWTAHSRDLRPAPHTRILTNSSSRWCSSCTVSARKWTKRCEIDREQAISLFACLFCCSIQMQINTHEMAKAYLLQQNNNVPRTTNMIKHVVAGLAGRFPGIQGDVVLPFPPRT